METIKKKINALKEDNEIKQEEIDRLQARFWLSYSLSDLSFKVLGTTGTFEIFEISWTTEKASAKTSEEENARLEQEIASLDNKIKLLEEQLEKTEDKLSKTTSDLQMIETVSVVRPLCTSKVKDYR